MTADHALNDLFDRYVLVSEENRADELERLCAGHPRHSDALRSMVAQLEESEAIVGSVANTYSGHVSVTDLDERIEILQRARDRDDYARLDRIARGGMAIIERVFDPRLRRTVAARPCRLTFVITARSKNDGVAR